MVHVVDHHHGDQQQKLVAQIAYRKQLTEELHLQDMFAVPVDHRSFLEAYSYLTSKRFDWIEITWILWQRYS
jgi:hypothetical protein